jgi:hypothetical protein
MNFRGLLYFLSKIIYGLRLYKLNLPERAKINLFSKHGA